MLRLTAIFAALLLFFSPALAEDAPLTLSQATSVNEVKQFLLLPPEDGLSAAQRGYIRYVSQDARDEAVFRKGYWLGGEEGSVLDLTLKELNGKKFTYHTGIMCTRAAYSMALSYLGIDLTPGEMSAMTGSRNLDDPYDDISASIGVERVIPRAYAFNTMIDNYLTDPDYSPVYLYFIKPNGGTHALLVVGKVPDGRYVAVDSNPFYVHGEPCRVFYIALDKSRSKIINSTFRQELVGSQLLQVCQWHLIETTDAE